MLEFVCGIPGADASTVAWHAAVHLGLAAFIVAAGAVFLTVAIVTFRRTAPRPGGDSAAGLLERAPRPTTAPASQMAAWVPVSTPARQRVRRR
jgi:hypothetical protein